MSKSSIHTPLCIGMSNLAKGTDCQVWPCRVHWNFDGGTWAPLKVCKLQQPSTPNVAGHGVLGSVNAEIQACHRPKKWSTWRLRLRSHTSRILETGCFPARILACQVHSSFRHSPGATHIPQLFRLSEQPEETTVADPVGTGRLKWRTWLVNRSATWTTCTNHRMGLG